MNGGLISPTETKHHLTLGGQICLNSAANNAISLCVLLLIDNKRVKNNPSNVFIASMQHFTIRINNIYQ